MNMESKMQMLVCLSLLALVSMTPASAVRQFQQLESVKNQRRYPHPQYLRQHPSTWQSTRLSSGLRALCVPTTSQTLEDHEGRHKCAYNHSEGYRAVGVAYNLDSEVETRKTELGNLFADYDKVYSGESCLWDIQISALLALDAMRALDNAAATVRSLDDFCCDVQAVFADVQHSVGAGGSFPDKDMKAFIEKTALKEWASAGQALNQTSWCSDHQKRCLDNIKTIKEGCAMLFTIGG